ncbi:ABZJ_00895 family protein [Cupriavidus numazuensis]|uniref:Uncharacterized protein n=1 Tax=Cupriavidus numazuensis TaxID=221992 RepID=A0ABN7QGN4_9BURK|nr:ABZJ_00895 family protein [Cupriavidus numazuensis]CAG2160825.1 hypothetical protein LMG26411_07792 [Cupriavidus numazuensis]
MSLKGFFIRFTVAYVVLLAAITVTLGLFDIDAGSAGSIGALAAAVTWSSFSFARINNRSFDREEKRYAVLGMVGINIVVQVLGISVLVAAEPNRIAPGAMLFGILFAALAHGVLIWFFVGLAEKQFAQQAKTIGR